MASKKTYTAATGKKLPELPKRGYFKIKDKGKQVKRLQKFLNWYGDYGLVISGTYNTKTVAAVKKFEKAEKLKADGLFDKKGLAKAKKVKKAVNKNSKKEKKVASKKTKKKVKSTKKITKKAAAKKKAKAPGLAKWGSISFSVNQKKVFTFRDMKRSYTIRWTDHNIIGKAPKSEFMGTDFGEITLEVIANAALGVKPRETIEKFRTAAEKGECNYFYINGTKVSSNKYRIVSGTESWNEIWNQGELVNATASLTFKEYR